MMLNDEIDDLPIKSPSTLTFKSRLTRNLFDNPIVTVYSKQRKVLKCRLGRNGVSPQNHIDTDDSDNQFIGINHHRRLPSNVD
jgi:hypothetical protein